MLASIILLAIVAILGWTFYFIGTNNNQNALTREQSTNKAIFAGLQGKISDLSKTNLEIQNAKGDLEQKTLNLQSTITAYAVQQTSLMSKISDLDNQNKQYEGILLCADGKDYSWDFSSNTSIADSLKKYYGDTIGAVKSNDWEVIWSNSKAAIHNIYGEYKETYIVSFADQKHRNQIYSASEQCYLVY